MKTSVALAFLGGLAAGAVVGILIAPDKGCETRAKILETLKEKGIIVSREQLDELVEKIKVRVKGKNVEETIENVIAELS